MDVEVSASDKMEESHRSLLTQDLVQTKSIERILAPIALQVSQLVLLNESYDDGDREAFPTDLQPSAAIVTRSTEGLVEAARHLCEESPDEELKAHMPEACEALIVAGQSLLLATQRVGVDNFSGASRGHLIHTAKQVLETTLKLLLVSDDGEVRQVVRAAGWVKDRLSLVTAARSIKLLVPAFKGFTEALMLLTSLAEKRQLMLRNPRQQEGVLTAIVALKKCVPMLNGAVQTAIKYPTNVQAKASKEYVAGQLLDLLEDLVWTLQNPNPKDYPVEDSEPGHFTASIDQAVSRLSERHRLESSLIGSDFDSLSEVVVRHSMTVAQIASKPHRALLIRHCQKLLRRRSQLFELVQDVEAGRGYAELRHDFDDNCERLIEEMQDLERHVTAAILSLLVDAFSETTEPLERLVKVAVTPTEAVDGGQREQTETLIAAFHAHWDRASHVTLLAAAGSQDAKTVRVLKCCVRHLEGMDPEIVPAVLACRQSPTDRAAMEHLRLLKTEWASNMDLILDTLDRLSDPQDFLNVSEEAMLVDVQRLKDSIYNEAREVAVVSRALIGRARRVVGVATRVIDSHCDAVFRNGAMTFIADLKRVIPAVKSAACQVVAEPGQQTAHTKLHKRCDLLLEGVVGVREALRGQRSPSLMDPRRDKVRLLQGLRALDLATEDPRNNSLGENEADGTVPPGGDPHTTGDRQATAAADRNNLKAYVSHLTHSHVTALTAELLSAAIAGRQKTVDLTGNKILMQCNHVTEVANQIIACLEDEDKKETWRQSVTSITQTTPRLLAKARKVVECDTYQIEPLHLAAEEWNKQVSFLESAVDGLVAQWLDVSGRVVSAAKTSNNQLLIAQSRSLGEHRKLVSEICREARRLAGDSSDVTAQGQSRLMEESEVELENTTSMLITASDLYTSSGSNEDEGRQLEVTAREWAVRVFCLTATADRLTVVAMGDAWPHLAAVVPGDVMSVREALRETMETSVRLKQTVDHALLGCGDGERRDEAEMALGRLDQASAALSACARLLFEAADPGLSPQRLYAPHTLRRLLADWTRQVAEVWGMLDHWAADYTGGVQRYLSAVQRIQHAQSARQNEDLQAACDMFCGDLCRNVLTAKTKALDAIAPSGDLEGNSTMRRCLEELTTCSDELESAARRLVGTEGKVQLDAIVAARRRWGLQCVRLATVLRSLTGCEGRAAQGAVSALKARSPGASQPSSTPGVKTKSPAKWSPDNKWSPSPAKDGKREDSREQDLTGSLLDFADDLDNSEVNSPKYPHSKQLATSSHVTPGSQRSWKEAASGPRMKHSTPAPPSEKSGFKPLKSARRSGEGLSSPFSVTFEADNWEDENNAFVRVAKEMARHLRHMSEFTKGVGPIQTKPQMIESAKEVARGGERLVRFARVLVMYSVDKRVAEDLRSSADHLPTIIAQLHILTSVKACTEEDSTTEKMLMKTAGNLVSAINTMLHNAEAICVKGINPPEGGDSLDETEAVVLATRWKRRFLRHRLQEQQTSMRDDLGLRRVDRQSTGPALTELLQQ